MDNRSKMKKLDDIDKITDEIIKQKKETKKMKLSDKSVKVTTIIKVIVITLAIIGAFVAGWFANPAYYANQKAEVTRQATELVQKLKIKE